jgi:hypothetical protein
MVRVDGRWRILDKSRELITSSRQLLQQLNRRGDVPKVESDRQATELDSPSPKLSGHLPDDR